jgi:D-lactate dehydrogenase
MKVAFFNSKKYDKESFTESNVTVDHELSFFEYQLDEKSALLAHGYDVVCVFVNDRLNKETLKILADNGTKLIAMRCAGYNNVDLHAAKDFGMTVVRVPAYSPNAVAEHVLALVLSLYRKTPRAYNRVREGNFALDGLIGCEIHGQTVGVIGTGKIGEIVACIFKGFGCRVLYSDIEENDFLNAQGIEKVRNEQLFKEADIVSLHCPLLEETHHIINREAIIQMKDGVTIINTSRGGLVDTQAVYEGLKSQKIGHLGIDVYEEEANLFFEDLSTEIIMDDLFMRLTTFPNVLITGHQAFLTNRALKNIADVTLSNISEFEKTGNCQNKIQ